MTSIPDDLRNWRDHAEPIPIKWSDRRSWKALGNARPGCELVYRLYDYEMQLLYVGITWHPFARWSAHSYRKQWWSLVAFAVLEEYPDDRTARVAETEAIKNERPRYNIHQAVNV